MQRQNQIEQIEYGKSGRDSEREGDRGEGEVEREREEGRKQQRTIKIADKLHTRRQGEGRTNPDTLTATQLGRGKGGYMPRPPLPSPVSPHSCWECNPLILQTPSATTIFGKRQQKCCGVLASNMTARGGVHHRASGAGCARWGRGATKRLRVCYPW